LFFSAVGAVLTVLKDREKVAMCTLPWRKPSRRKNDDET
jgi:hypothetical protein